MDRQIDDWRLKRQIKGQTKGKVLNTLSQGEKGDSDSDFRDSLV